VCVFDSIYGLITKKIAFGNLRKMIVTPKEDNLFLYIMFYGVTIIFLTYMVSRTHTYNKIVQLNLAAE
jgi:hypothetical protein